MNLLIIKYNNYSNTSFDNDYKPSTTVELKTTGIAVFNANLRETMFVQCTPPKLTITCLYHFLMLLTTMLVNYWFVT